MPTYQYACTACEHRFEAVQSFSDASLTECPQCSGTLRKVFSSVGIVFKGSGFYRTDSRSGSSVPGKEPVTTPAGDAGKSSAGESPASAPAKKSSEPASSGTGSKAAAS